MFGLNKYSCFYETEAINGLSLLCGCGCWIWETESVSKAAEVMTAEARITGNLGLSEAAGESLPVLAVQKHRKVIVSCHCLVSTVSHGYFCCRENDANRFQGLNSSSK